MLSTKLDHPSTFLYSKPLYHRPNFLWETAESIFRTGRGQLLYAFGDDTRRLVFRVRWR
jgi:hypothetical protein